MYLLQDIDIAVAPMKMTAEREEVIDFVAPYFEQTGILIGRFKGAVHLSTFDYHFPMWFQLSESQ